MSPKLSWQFVGPAPLPVRATMVLWFMHFFAWLLAMSVIESRCQTSSADRLGTVHFRGSRICYAPELIANWVNWGLAIHFTGMAVLAALFFVYRRRLKRVT